MSDTDTPQVPSVPNFQDVTLYDKDTGEPFIFTAKEQEFFARQGFTHVPAHSPERRKLLREQRYKGKPIFNVKCMSCGRVGKVTQEPPYPRQILCEYCFDEKWNAFLEANPEKRALYEDAAAIEPLQGQAEPELPA
ncbi:MAG: zinc-ribbon domain containing protein [bacterium]